MQAFDASSIIHGWDHYPITQFPKLWDWLGEEFKAGLFTLPQVADDETAQRAPDCHQWLHLHSARVIPVTQEILEEALKIKKILGIASEQDYRGGVGENDLLIIATCMHTQVVLVSNEGRQNTLPQNLANCKIPAVCGMSAINVNCISFRELLVESRKVFG